MFVVPDLVFTVTYYSLQRLCGVRNQLLNGSVGHDAIKASQRHPWLRA